MCYILYTTYQRHKADKKFWEKQIEISDKFIESIKAQTDAVIDEVTENKNEKE